jgi:hypothetical protein
MTGKMLSMDELTQLNEHARAVIRKCGMTYDNVMEQLADQLKLICKKEPAHEQSPVS